MIFVLGLFISLILIWIETTIYGQKIRPRTKTKKREPWGLHDAGFPEKTTIQKEGLAAKSTHSLLKKDRN